ncbi:hypothetical protein PMAYCL1PPCAC_19204, partial [Pristionchus mayeri]
NFRISHPPLPENCNCEAFENLLRNCWSALKHRWPFSHIFGQFKDVKEEINDLCMHMWIKECK